MRSLDDEFLYDEIDGEMVFTTLRKWILAGTIDGNNNQYYAHAVDSGSHDVIYIYTYSNIFNETKKWVDNIKDSITCGFSYEECVQYFGFEDPFTTTTDIPTHYKAPSFVSAIENNNTTMVDNVNYNKPPPMQKNKHAYFSTYSKAVHAPSPTSVRHFPALSNPTSNNTPRNPTHPTQSSTNNTKSTHTSNTKSTHTSNTSLQQLEDRLNQTIANNSEIIKNMESTMAQQQSLLELLIIKSEQQEVISRDKERKQLLREQHFMNAVKAVVISNNGSLASISAISDIITSNSQELAQSDAASDGKTRNPKRKQESTSSGYDSESTLTGRISPKQSIFVFDENLSLEIPASWGQ